MKSRQETLLKSVRERFEAVKTHNLQILSVDPHLKDGGVFVQFKCKTPDSKEVALKSIEESLKKQAMGGIATWSGTQRPNVWLVKGSPWREVCNHLV